MPPVQTEHHIRQAGLIFKISAADIRMHAGKPDLLEIEVSVRVAFVLLLGRGRPADAFEVSSMEIACLAYPTFGFSVVSAELPNAIMV